MAVNTGKAIDSFLPGGGEMGERIRSFDWSSSPVGPPEQWPQSLRTTLSIILNSAFPMLLFWGKNLTSFYNDAFRPSLGNEGKHPSALGQDGKVVWSELWHIIGPMLEGVIQKGQAVYFENLLVPFNRNGHLENTYFTFSYSPVNDESGSSAGVFVTCMETTGHLLSHKQTTESKDQLQFAIDAAELGTWDFNPATNKFSGNARLKEWFGLEKDDEIDLNLAINIIAVQDRERVSKAIATALDFSSGGKYDTEYSILNPRDGITRVVRAKGRAWFDEQNVAIRFNGTLQDVTRQAIDRNHIEEIVQERTQSLKRSNEQLLQFANITSHDLQEPARKIRTFADMLRKNVESSIDQKSLSYLVKIEDSSARMLRLIRDVLTISQLSIKDQKFENVDLNQVLRDTQNDFELLIGEKGCSVESDVLPIVKAIPIQMYQLFGNLISNALKFSTSAALRIKITFTELPPADVLDFPDLKKASRYYKIAFADNGIGFEQDNAQQIFEIFKRLHNESAYRGTGIGLAMCKRIAENHGGTIFASSAPGAGSVFTVILPGA